jgi:hypothetical protein
MRKKNKKIKKVTFLGKIFRFFGHFWGMRVKKSVENEKKCSRQIDRKWSIWVLKSFFFVFFYIFVAWHPQSCGPRREKFLPQKIFFLKNFLKKKKNLDPKKSMKCRRFCAGNIVFEEIAPRCTMFKKTRDSIGQKRSSHS